MYILPEWKVKNFFNWMAGVGFGAGRGGEVIVKPADYLYPYPKQDLRLAEPPRRQRVTLD